MIVARQTETFTPVRDTAKCQTTDSVGDLVYISGPRVLGSLQVTKAGTSDYSKMPAVAVIIAKPTSTTCVIQFSGEVEGIYSGLVPGRVYHVGADGRPSQTPPPPTLGMRSYAQQIGVALDTDLLQLSPHIALRVFQG